MEVGPLGTSARGRSAWNSSGRVHSIHRTNEPYMMHDQRREKAERTFLQAMLKICRNCHIDSASCVIFLIMLRAKEDYSTRKQYWIRLAKPLLPTVAQLASRGKMAGNQRGP